MWLPGLGDKEGQKEHEHMKTVYGPGPWQEVHGPGPWKWSMDPVQSPRSSPVSC